MSKFVNGGTRTKNARETYVEQLPYGRGLTPFMNKKRKPFTHLNSSNNNDLAYLSTPDYLRQLTQQALPEPTELFLARNVPRTKSASEMTPRNNLNRSITGNPKYKAQEDYYDDIQALKKEMKTVKDENSNLRAKIRRLEEDNARKRKEIDALCDTSKDGDLRRTLSGSSTDRNNNLSAANVVMSLKQRVFKLELQLKQKETALDEMKSDPKWTKSTQLEIQNRALFNELERQKVERLNYIQQNDYMGSIDEEKKNAVRKLTREKDDLKQENEILKRKVQEFEKLGRGEQSSARSSNDRTDKELQRKIDDLQRDCNHYEDELAHMKDDLKLIRRERDQIRDKLDQANEDLEAMRREHGKQTKLNSSGRSSPTLKREEEPLKSFSRPSTPTRKSNEQFGPRISSPGSSNTSMNAKKSVTPLKASAKNIHGDGWTKEDNNRVKNFREKHAATVIQRGWRRHEKTRDKNKTRQSSLRTVATTKPFNVQSPRSSFRVDNAGSDIVRSRPSSPDNSNESAVKTVQASLRGYLKRSDVAKIPSQTISTSPRSRSPAASLNNSKHIDSDDDDIIIAPPVRSQYGGEKTRDSPIDPPRPNSRQSLVNDRIGSNSQLPLNNQDLASKNRRPVSPLPDSSRSSVPRIGIGGGSKQNLLNDRNKLDSGSRVPISDRDSAPKLQRAPSPIPENQRPSSPYTSGGFKPTLLNDRNKLDSGNRVPISDRDSASKLHRAPSPIPENQRPSSPYSGGFKPTLLNDRNKLDTGNRFPTRDRESTSALKRPSSPSNVRRPISPSVPDRQSSGRISPENSRPSSRKSSTNSKPSITAIPSDSDDDDDAVVIG